MPVPHCLPQPAKHCVCQLSEPGYPVLSPGVRGFSIHRAEPEVEESVKQTHSIREAPAAVCPNRGSDEIKCIKILSYVSVLQILPWALGQWVWCTPGLLLAGV